MSSRDEDSRVGSGARRAVAASRDPAGEVPAAAPRPAAGREAAAAGESMREELASAGGSPAAARAADAAIGSGMSADDAKWKIARAGLRETSREYPAMGDVQTPVGRARATALFERSTRGGQVGYVRTDEADYPGSTDEPKTYAAIGRRMSRAVAGRISDVPEAESGHFDEWAEGADSLRAGATASALATVSEAQRNGGRKHARAAARAVATGRMTGEEVYSGDTPGFPQARRPKGMEHHRKMMRGDREMTAGEREVVDHFSSSSDDDEVSAMSREEAMHAYRARTETKRARMAMDAEGVPGGSSSSTPAGARPPRSSYAKRHRRTATGSGTTPHGGTPTPAAAAALRSAGGGSSSEYRGSATKRRASEIAPSLPGSASSAASIRPASRSRTGPRPAASRPARRKRGRPPPRGGGKRR